MSLQKANSLMRGLREKLVYRLPSTYIFSDSVDASGNPVLTIAQDGTWNAADQYLIIRIRPVSNINTNSLGLAQESFSPHEVQIVSEASASAGISVLTDLNLEKVLFECSRLGTAIEFYLSVNTVQPVVADLSDSTKLQIRLDDLIEPGLVTV